MKGTHEYQDDPRNATILIDINGTLYPRNEARISVFDSGFILGDGIWEGLRVHHGHIAFLAQHLQRLYEGAAALDIQMDVDSATLTDRLYALLKANNMEHGIHIRLMVSRGVKATPYQDPRVTITAPTIVIIAEYKSPHENAARKGLDLFTVHVRRGYPDVQDPKLNSHSKLNCITACIQATKAGADEALMLDPHGFVATCNSTHFFIVRNGEVWTSTGDFCLGGVTRGNIIKLCRQNDIPVFEKNFSLMQAYSANESFVTGTFAGVAPVRSIDGRRIGTGERGPMVERLQSLYLFMIKEQA